MSHAHLDLEVLRTFVTGIHLGTYARAAVRLHRSPAAVSAQLKKLERQAGVPLFRKAGRGLALTEGGEQLLAYARRLLELNDEAVAAVRGAELEGWVRLGLQQDFGEGVLPTVLGRFSRAHHRVRIEARVARNAELLAAVAEGRLDLALVWEDGGDGPDWERVAEVPMAWIGGEGFPGVPGGGEEPLPLVAVEAPCRFRRAGTAALDAAGIPWRCAVTSASLSGVWAAVAAGIGVTPRTAVGIPPGARVLDPASSGLPPLPSIALSLFTAEASPAPAVRLLASMLRETVDAVTGHGG